MSETEAEERSLLIEREFAHPPEKLWRALTQPHLIEEWLMKNDFDAAIGKRFRLTSDWGAIDCVVVACHPNHKLSYTWVSSGLDSVVTWTLTPTATGTRLTVEQSGFQPDQTQAFQGAKAGWPRFLGKFEQLLTRIG